MQVKFNAFASCVPMHVLPWPQHKTWMPNGSRGCIHTHWKKPTIKYVGIPIHSATTNKTWGRIGLAMSLAHKSRLEHERINV
jgi:hypothetical protein